MKKIIIAFTAVLLFSCGADEKKANISVLESNDLAQIKELRSKMTKDLNGLKSRLEQINKKIVQLDTVNNYTLVTILPVLHQEFNHFVELQGDVQTEKDMLVFPEYPGVMNRVYVKEGQYVSKGQVMASVDAGSLPQQISQLKVQLALAKTTYERQQRLWNKKIGSEIDFLSTKANYQAQQEAVKQLQVTMRKTKIRAPFSGIVEDIIVQQGTVVQPGMQVMRVVNNNDIKVVAQVPEKYLQTIKKGTDVLIHFPVLGKEINAAVTQTSSTIDPANRKYKAEIKLSNSGGIKPNLTAKLLFNDYNNKESVMIPLSLISENAQNQKYVFVTQPTKKKKLFKVKKVIVETGLDKDGLIEVTSGLKAGDIILNEGVKDVKENQIVEVLKIDA